jgi:hypothetical protein
MNSSFEFLDYLIFVTYAIVILGLGLMGFKKQRGGREKCRGLFFSR